MANCAYTVLIKTGTIDSAGTDATVSLKLGGPDRQTGEFDIRDLEKCGGVMESGRDYFENGQLDVFKVVGPCFPGPPCWMLLSHDNTGRKPGWYVEYVEVFAFPTEPDRMGWFQHFDVNQWLALDEEPHQLFAVRNKK